MFEYAKQHLHTSITPHLTTLNQTITTLRPHPTTSTSATAAGSTIASSTGTLTTSNSATATTPKSMNSLSSLVQSSTGAGLGNLSDLHPLINNPHGHHHHRKASKKESDGSRVGLSGLLSGVGGLGVGGGNGSIGSDIDSDLTTAPEFNHIYFESELFKITLADAEHNTLDVNGGKRFNSEVFPMKGTGGATPGDVVDLKMLSAAANTSGPYVPAGSVFYIHKALLASLSPELRKHTDNQMKEGLHGEMILGEVDRATMQRFLQWAYRGEYTVTTPDGASPTTDLLEHIKLYVFGDRFNIGPLQNLSFHHILEILPSLQLRSQNHQDDMLLLLRAVRYSADNLPSTDDELMIQLILTLAWALESISVLPEFAIVIHAQPEVAVAVCRSARGSTEPPWTQVEYKKPKPQLKQDITRYEVKPRKSKCGKNGCGFLGFPMLQCKRCKKCWQDARTGYPEHDWKFATCRFCGEEETSASLFEVCPVCKEGDALKWF